MASDIKGLLDYVYKKSKVENALHCLLIERACVARGPCDRDCGKCDLAQDQDMLLDGLEEAIRIVRDYMPRIYSMEELEKIAEENGTSAKKQCNVWVELTDEQLNDIGWVTIFPGEYDDSFLVWYDGNPIPAVLLKREYGISWRCYNKFPRQ